MLVLILKVIMYVYVQYLITKRYHWPGAQGKNLGLLQHQLSVASPYTLP